VAFAYNGGFETTLTPSSEAKHPRRDAAFALFTSGGHLHSSVLGDPADRDRKSCPICGTAKVHWRTWPGSHSGRVARSSCQYARSFQFTEVSAPIGSACPESPSRSPRMEISLPSSQRFIPDSGLRTFRFLPCPVELVACAARQVHLESAAFRRGRLLYYRLVYASLPVFRPQAAWGGDISSSRRALPRRVGRRDLYAADHRCDH
jgi:hypothetical protein